MATHCLPTAKGRDIEVSNAMDCHCNGQICNKKGLVSIVLCQHSRWECLLQDKMCHGTQTANALCYKNDLDKWCSVMAWILWIWPTLSSKHARKAISGHFMVKKYMFAIAREMGFSWCGELNWLGHKQQIPGKGSIGNTMTRGGVTLFENAIDAVHSGHHDWVHVWRA